MEIETLVKRHRESIASPQREEKRKKEERETAVESGRNLLVPPKPPTQQTSKYKSGAVPKTQEGK